MDKEIQKLQREKIKQDHSHYDACRLKYNQIKVISFVICLPVAVISTSYTVDFVTDDLLNASIGGMEIFTSLLLTLLCDAAAISGLYGITEKKPVYCLAAAGCFLLLSIVTSDAFYLFESILMGACAYVADVHRELSKVEGYPYFNLRFTQYDEKKEEKKDFEQYLDILQKKKEEEISAQTGSDMPMVTAENEMPTIIISDDE